MLGFGFALFLIMVILALIYSQYAAQKTGGSVETVTDMKKTSMPMESAKPLPATATPEAVADDLIDEALADRDDLDQHVIDEMEALEDGN